ncbi:MAG: FAD binding domain-containing protein [Desulfobacteraceae bacterium]|nr:FAD binding domain-containing protein [Desulfobacteraceae bacterium]
MLLPKFEFHEPGSVKEALELKKKWGSIARVLAGGTDLLVQWKPARSP